MDIRNNSHFALPHEDASDLHDRRHVEAFMPVRRNGQGDRSSDARSSFHVSGVSKQVHQRFSPSIRGESNQMSPNSPHLESVLIDCECRTANQNAWRKPCRTVQFTSPAKLSVLVRYSKMTSDSSPLTKSTCMHVDGVLPRRHTRTAQKMVSLDRLHAS